MQHLQKWWLAYGHLILLGLVTFLNPSMNALFEAHPAWYTAAALWTFVLHFAKSPIAGGSASSQAGYGRAGSMTLSALCALAALFIVGCNAYQTAQKAHDIVAAVVAVAQADLPSLTQTGVFSASESAAVTGYLNLAVNLNGQYATCLSNANNSTLNKKSKFLGCLDAFAAGLSDPKELASLRIMNPKAQQQVQLWVTAASVGVSSVIAALGGQAPAAPQVTQLPPAAGAQVAFDARVRAAARL